MKATFYKATEVHFPCYTCYWVCMYRLPVYKDLSLLVPRVVFLDKFHCIHKIGLCLNLISTDIEHRLIKSPVKK